MTKKRRRQRKKLNRPNIPEQTLEQVKQAVTEAEDEIQEPADDDNTAEELHTDDLTDEQLRALAAQQRMQQLRNARYELREARRSDRKRRKGEALDGADIARLLANPTKHVTEGELKTQYSYVLADLRNMGILAAILFAVLIGLGVVGL
jgi:hypothetical protein